MSGPAPIPPPRRGARAARVILRVLYVAVPPATIGILSWIPMVRLAVRSRRGWDWFWCGAVAVSATASFVLVGESHNDSSWQAGLGTAVLILLALGVPVYFLVADLRWHDAHRAGTALPVYFPVAVHPPAAPNGRIDQVRAELDELSAYLRKQEGA